MSPTATRSAAGPSGYAPAGRPEPLSDQIAKKRRTRRRLRWGVGTAVLLALLGAATWLVYFSAVLDTRTVSVSGTHRLTHDQVVRAVAVPLGVPLAKQDPTALAQRATAIPAVSRARVTRVWPHTVQVAVTERVPLLALAKPGGFLVVDREGVGFVNVTAVPAGVIKTEASTNDQALLVELGSLALALPASVRSQVTQISATNRDAITVRLDSGLLVTWGNADQSALKAQVTTALLGQKPKTSIDVSSPHHPAYR